MKVKVKVGQAKTQILKETKEELILAVKAKPEDGKANREIERFLGRYYGCECRIIRGKTSRLKTVRFIT